MKGGAPDSKEGYSVVETGQLKVYVPENMNFSGDIPQIVKFPRKNGSFNAGVTNVMD